MKEEEEEEQVASVPGVLVLAQCLVVFHRFLQSGRDILHRLQSASRKLAKSPGSLNSAGTFRLSKTF